MLGRGAENSSFQTEGTAQAKARCVCGGGVCVRVQDCPGGHWSQTGRGLDRYNEAGTAGNAAENSGLKCKWSEQGKDKQTVIHLTKEEYHSAREENKRLRCLTIRRNVKNVMLSERSQMQKEHTV